MICFIVALLSIPFIAFANLRHGKLYGYLLWIVGFFLFFAIIGFCTADKIETFQRRESPDKCGKNLFVTLKDPQILTESSSLVLSLFYLMPLTNCMMNSITIYIIPVHQRLKLPDPGCIQGRRSLYIAIAFTSFFYAVTYYSTNLGCDEGDYTPPAPNAPNTIRIPLVLNYLINGTGYGLIPILAFVCIMAGL